MHVAVLQSAYIPWRGYFDVIASVDLFVIYDDVQYSKGSWRNRNKVATAQGPKWLTVPVNISLGQTIQEVAIAYGSKDWVAQHQGLIAQSLGAAPHYEKAVAPWRVAVDARPVFLSELNVSLLRSYCNLLGIATQFANSTDYVVQGSATERLIMLLKAIGATSYLSGPAAKAYLDLQAFRDAGIDLYYKTYDYEGYPQLHEGFQSDASIIDLIANVGAADALRHLRSRSGDEKVSL